MAASFYSTRKKERERKARKLEGNMTKRRQRKKDEKYDPLIILREDIKRIRASISDSSLTHRQRWRQTEDVGLPSCLRVCTKLKGKISQLSSLDATEAEKLSAVYDELFTTINVMAQDHKEYISNVYDEEEVVKKYVIKKRPENNSDSESESETDDRYMIKKRPEHNSDSESESETDDSSDFIEAEKLLAAYVEQITTINFMAQDDKEYISYTYDKEEVLKKYYNKTVLDILELWSSCASATVDLMVPLVEKYWKKREYKQLAKKISNTCSACVKFSAMAVNFTKHPLPENCGSDVKEKAIQEMNNTADTLGRLIQTAIKTSLKVSEDSLLDMTMWLLFSVHHVAQNVLQPKDKPTTESKKNKQSKETEQEKKDPEPVKESTNVTASLNNLLTQLHALQMELSKQYVIKKRPEHNSDSESESETDDSSDSIEAEELSAVYDEQCTTINVMAQDDKEYISNTYDKEEVLKK